MLNDSLWTMSGMMMLYLFIVTLHSTLPFRSDRQTEQTKNQILFAGIRFYYGGGS